MQGLKLDPEKLSKSLLSHLCGFFNSLFGTPFFLTAIETGSLCVPWVEICWNPTSRTRSIISPCSDTKFRHFFPLIANPSLLCGPRGGDNAPRFPFCSWLLFFIVSFLSLILLWRGHHCKWKKSPRSITQGDNVLSSHTHWSCLFRNNLRLGDNRHFPTQIIRKRRIKKRKRRECPQIFCPRPPWSIEGLSLLGVLRRWVQK